MDETEDRHEPNRKGYTKHRCSTSSMLGSSILREANIEDVAQGLETTHQALTIVPPRSFLVKPRLMKTGHLDGEPELKSFQKYGINQPDIAKAKQNELAYPCPVAGDLDCSIFAEQVRSSSRQATLSELPVDASSLQQLSPQITGLKKVVRTIPRGGQKQDTDPKMHPTTNLASQRPQHNPDPKKPQTLNRLFSTIGSSRNKEKLNWTSGPIESVSGVDDMNSPQITATQTKRSSVKTGLANLQTSRTFTLDEYRHFVGEKQPPSKIQSILKKTTRGGSIQANDKTRAGIQYAPASLKADELLRNKSTKFSKEIVVFNFQK